MNPWTLFFVEIFWFVIVFAIMSSSKKPGMGCLTLTGYGLLAFGGAATIFYGYGYLLGQVGIPYWYIAFTLAGLVLIVFMPNLDNRCPQCKRINALRVAKEWSGDKLKVGRSAYSWKDYKLIQCQYCQYNRTDSSDRYEDLSP